MRILIAGVVLVVLVGVALAAPDHSDSFDEFKTKYNKNYETDVEEAHRAGVWQNNVNLIQKHNVDYNLGVHTYNIGENEHADLTPDEFRSFFNGFVDGSTSGEVANFDEFAAEDMDETVDWRKKGYVTPVKNQKQCGSCWAFSATGSLEGAHFAKTGKLVSLSEQNLVDCSMKEGNHGCFGGLMDFAFKYVKDNGGIDTEESYPYKAKNGNCSYNSDNSGATLTSWKDIPKGNETALKMAVSKVGPISVAIDASRPTFHLYKSGVYSDAKCSSRFLDHGVLAVGYGTTTLTNGISMVVTDKDYWLVKNSWGETWGDKGYIMMARDDMNMCGIASAASYPIV